MTFYLNPTFLEKKTTWWNLRHTFLEKLLNSKVAKYEIKILLFGEHGAQKSCSYFKFIFPLLIGMGLHV